MTRVGWLAGIIDGEGCIGLYRTNNGSDLAPQLMVSMRDEVAIQEVAKITSNLGIQCPIKRRPYKNGMRALNQRKAILSHAL